MLLLMLAGAVLVLPAMVWAQNGAGIRLTISVDQADADLMFPLGDPIKIMLVNENRSGWTINTERGFSQEELHHNLIVTDPSGSRLSLREEKEGHKMPPTLFLNGQPTIRAETLPVGWVKSTTIANLENLFPIMKTTPGWYTIQAQQPFVSFAWTRSDPGLGLLGVADDPGNWYGTIQSNTMQIFIAPSAGAAVKARVVNAAAHPIEPLALVPVKIFRKTDLPGGYTPQSVWSTADPVLSGRTDFDGNSVWETGSSCLSEDEYDIIAKYANQYQKILIGRSPAETGWGSDCSGTIEKQIAFGSGIAGDMDGDGDSDGKDFYNFVTAYSNQLPAADLNGDGQWNAADIEVFAAGFGQ